ncbi:MAG: GerW family sporulation protein [Lachnospiraceae bacterium]|nr:GerW family sporulation protein [Lachnospiraceae bacterium]
MADSSNRFNGIVDNLFKGMKNMDGFLSTKTVVGESITVGDTILIPLVDVSFGMFAGAGHNKNGNSGAGGMGGKITPSAVLVIRNNNAKIVSVKNQDNFSRVIDLVPEIMEKLKKDKDGELSKEEIIDNAFPDKE